ncbi:helix-turn-helix domain-containing protein [Natroniella acetigena]|uniref:helix-turn-helix domain-containing protein n=1 Tax=Natroniella acetigena TaxID=52004 RepID=UPI00200A5BD3|nr:helix-turn-helix domain-containing protein [Natroniella acetigena]MCK8826372.1 helix-turn-helix domain-containing protein [Natroniella acetigena]
MPGLLEKLTDDIVSQLESIGQRLKKLEQRPEYCNDIKMYNVEEVAEKTSLSETKIYDLIRQGKFPCVVAGRRKLIPRKDLVRWINENNVMNQGQKEVAILG